MRETTTRNDLLYQIASAKKAIADIEAAFERAEGAERPRVLALLRRGEVYRDNLLAVLADYDKGLEDLTAP